MMHEQNKMFIVM